MSCLHFKQAYYIANIVLKDIMGRVMPVSFANRLIDDAVRFGRLTDDIEALQNMPDEAVGQIIKQYVFDLIAAQKKTVTNFNVEEFLKERAPYMQFYYDYYRVNHSNAFIGQKARKERFDKKDELTMVYENTEVDSNTVAMLDISPLNDVEKTLKVCEKVLSKGGKIMLPSMSELETLWQNSGNVFEPRLLHAAYEELITTFTNAGYTIDEERTDKGELKSCSIQRKVDENYLPLVEAKKTSNNKTNKKGRFIKKDKEQQSVISKIENEYEKQITEIATEIQNKRDELENRYKNKEISQVEKQLQDEAINAEEDKANEKITKLQNERDKKIEEIKSGDNKEEVTVRSVIKQILEKSKKKNSNVLSRLANQKKQIKKGIDYTSDNLFNATDSSFSSEETPTELKFQEVTAFDNLLGGNLQLKERLISGVVDNIQDKLFEDPQVEIFLDYFDIIIGKLANKIKNTESKIKSAKLQQKLKSIQLTRKLIAEKDFSELTKNDFALAVYLHIYLSQAADWTQHVILNKKYEKYNLIDGGVLNDEDFDSLLDALPDARFEGRNALTHFDTMSHRFLKDIFGPIRKISIAEDKALAGLSDMSDYEFLKHEGKTEEEIPKLLEEDEKLRIAKENAYNICGQMINEILNALSRRFNRKINLTPEYFLKNNTEKFLFDVTELEDIKADLNTQEECGSAENDYHDADAEEESAHDIQMVANDKRSVVETMNIDIKRTLSFIRNYKYSEILFDEIPDLTKEIKDKIIQETQENIDSGEETHGFIKDDNGNIIGIYRFDYILNNYTDSVEHLPFNVVFSKLMDIFQYANNKRGFKDSEDMMAYFEAHKRSYPFLFSLVQYLRTKPEIQTQLYVAFTKGQYKFISYVSGSYHPAEYKYGEQIQSDRGKEGSNYILQSNRYYRVNENQMDGAQTLAKQVQQSINSGNVLETGRRYIDREHVEKLRTYDQKILSQFNDLRSGQHYIEYSLKNISIYDTNGGINKTALTRHQIGTLNDGKPDWEYEYSGVKAFSEFVSKTIIGDIRKRYGTADFDTLVKQDSELFEDIATALRAIGIDTNKTDVKYALSTEIDSEGKISGLPFWRFQQAMKRLNDKVAGIEKDKTGIEKVQGANTFRFFEFIAPSVYSVASTLPTLNVSMVEASTMVGTQMYNSYHNMSLIDELKKVLGDDQNDADVEQFIKDRYLLDGHRSYFTERDALGNQVILHPFLDMICPSGKRGARSAGKGEGDTVTTISKALRKCFGEYQHKFLCFKKEELHNYSDDFTEFEKMQATDKFRFEFDMWLNPYRKANGSREFFEAESSLKSIGLGMAYYALPTMADSSNEIFWALPKYSDLDSKYEGSLLYDLALSLKMELNRIVAFRSNAYIDENGNKVPLDNTKLPKTFAKNAGKINKFPELNKFKVKFVDVSNQQHELSLVDCLTKAMADPSAFADGVVTIIDTEGKSRTVTLNRTELDIDVWHEIAMHALHSYMDIRVLQDVERLKELGVFSFDPESFYGKFQFINMPECSDANYQRKQVTLAVAQAFYDSSELKFDENGELLPPVRFQEIFDTLRNFDINDFENIAKNAFPRGWRLSPETKEALEANPHLLMDFILKISKCEYYGFDELTKSDEEIERTEIIDGDCDAILSGFIKTLSGISDTGVVNKESAIYKAFSPLTFESRVHKHVVTNSLTAGLGEEYHLFQKLRHFIWNSIMAKDTMYALTVGDLAQFKGATDLSKRFKAVVAAYERCDMAAKRKDGTYVRDYYGNEKIRDKWVEAQEAKGRKISSKYKNKWIENQKTIVLEDLETQKKDNGSQEITGFKGVSTFFNEQLLPELYRKQQAGVITMDEFNNIVKAYQSESTTDGITYRTLESTKKIYDFLGLSTRETNEVYERLMAGEHVPFAEITNAFQQQKDVAINYETIYNKYSNAAMSDEEKSEIKEYALNLFNLIKDSTYTLLPYSKEFQEYYGDNSLISGIMKFCKENQVDCVHFASTQKINVYNTINISECENGTDVYETLNKALEQADAVRDDRGFSTKEIWHAESWRLIGRQVSTTQDHVTDHTSKMGAQLDALIRSQMPKTWWGVDENGNPKEFETKITVYSSDGSVDKQLDPKQFYDLTTYVQLTNVRKNLKALEEQFETKEKFSEYLIHQLEHSELYSEDLKRAIQINPLTHDFFVSIDNPVILQKIMPVLSAMVSKRINTQTTSGGTVYETPSFGFAMQNEHEEGFTPQKKKNPITGQEEIDYIPCRMPYWSKTLFEAYADANGDIDINDIPIELREMIGYRVPTENFYSIMPFRIVGFLRPEQGTSIMVPQEIVTWAGSDFDIDKLFIHYKKFQVERNTNIKEIDSKKAWQQFYLSELSSNKADSNVKRAVYRWREIAKQYKNDAASSSIKNKKQREQTDADIEYLIDVIDDFFENRTNDNINALVFDKRIKQAMAELANYKGFKSRGLIADCFSSFEFKSVREEFENFALKSGIINEEKKVVIPKINLNVSEGTELSEEDMLKIFNEVEDASRAARENLLVDLYSARLKSDFNALRLHKPGGFPTVKKISVAMTIRNAKANGTLAAIYDEIKTSQKNQELASVVGELLNLSNDRVFSSLMSGKIEYSNGSTLEIRDSVLSELKELCDNNEVSPLDASTDYVLFNRNMVGKRMVSIMAIHVKFQALFESLNYSGGLLEFSDEFKKNFKVSIDGKSPMALGSMFNNKTEPNSPIRYFTADALGEPLAASVDNAKDPTLDAMGLNDYTANIFANMLHLGYPIETVSLLMNQPIIKKAVKLASLYQKSSFSFYEFFRDSICKNMLNIDINNDLLGRNIDVNSGELDMCIGMDFDSMPKEGSKEYEIQMNVAKVIGVMTMISKTIDDLQGALGYSQAKSSFTNKFEKTLTNYNKGRYYKKSNYQKFHKKSKPIEIFDRNIFNSIIYDNYEEELHSKEPKSALDYVRPSGSKASRVPYIQGMMDYGLIRPMQMFAKYFTAYRPETLAVIDAVNEYAKRTSDERPFSLNDKDIQSIITAQMLFKSSNDILNTVKGGLKTDYSLEEIREAFITTFPDVFMNFLKDYRIYGKIKGSQYSSNNDRGIRELTKEFEILNHIVKAERVYYDYGARKTLNVLQFAKSGRVDKSTQGILTQSWLNMVNDSDPVVAKYGRLLWVYTFLLNGSRYGFQTFGSYAPASLMMKFPDALESMKQVVSTSNQDEFNKFLDQLIRNKPKMFFDENSAVFPYFPTKPQGNSKKERVSILLSAIKDGDEFKDIVRFDLSSFNTKYEAAMYFAVPISHKEGRSLAIYKKEVDEQGNYYWRKEVVLGNEILNLMQFNDKEPLNISLKLNINQSYEEAKKRRAASKIIEEKQKREQEQQGHINEVLSKLEELSDRITDDRDPNVIGNNSTHYILDGKEYMRTHDYMEQYCDNYTVVDKEKATADINKKIEAGVINSKFPLSVEGYSKTAEIGSIIGQAVDEYARLYFKKLNGEELTKDEKEYMDTVFDSNSPGYQRSWLYKTMLEKFGYFGVDKYKLQQSLKHTKWSVDNELGKLVDKINNDHPGKNKFLCSINGKSIKACTTTIVNGEEVSVGGEIDMLVAHADGTFSIVDFKTIGRTAATIIYDTTIGTKSLGSTKYIPRAVTDDDIWAINIWENYKTQVNVYRSILMNMLSKEGIDITINSLYLATFTSTKSYEYPIRKLSDGSYEYSPSPLPTDQKGEIVSVRITTDSGAEPKDLHTRPVQIDSNLSNIQDPPRTLRKKNQDEPSTTIETSTDDIMNQIDAILTENLVDVPKSSAISTSSSSSPASSTAGSFSTAPSASVATSSSVSSNAGSNLESQGIQTIGELRNAMMSTIGDDSALGLIDAVIGEITNTELTRYGNTKGEQMQSLLSDTKNVMKLFEKRGHPVTAVVASQISKGVQEWSKNSNKNPETFDAVFRKYLGEDYENHKEAVANVLSELSNTEEDLDSFIGNTLGESYYAYIINSNADITGKYNIQKALAKEGIEIDSKIAKQLIAAMEYVHNLGRKDVVAEELNNTGKAQSDAYNTKSDIEKSKEDKKDKVDDMDFSGLRTYKDVFKKFGIEGADELLSDLNNKKVEAALLNKLTWKFTEAEFNDIDTIKRPKQRTYMRDIKRFFPNVSYNELLALQQSLKHVHDIKDDSNIKIC